MVSFVCTVCVCVWLGHDATVLEQLSKALTLLHKGQAHATGYCVAYWGIARSYAVTVLPLPSSPTLALPVLLPPRHAVAP